jgi:hypothetical protein
MEAALLRTQGSLLIRRHGLTRAARQVSDQYHRDEPRSTDWNSIGVQVYQDYDGETCSITPFPIDTTSAPT